MTDDPCVPDDRLPALDVARGLAVLGMVWLHFVATEGGDGATERVAAAVGTALYGKPAALFCVLAGVSWAIQASRWGGRPGFRAYVLRRAASLAALGVLFGRTVWPTEILTPLALMMPLVMLAWRAGTAAIALSLVALLVATPCAYLALGDYAWSDWNDDGTVHRAESTLGWITLRYYAYSGNYPLLTWLAFPMGGALAVRLGSLDPRRAARAAWVWLPIAVAAIASTRWASNHEGELGELGPHLTATWVPTSIPFVLVGASASLGLIAVVVAAGARVSWLASLGRTSLTVYVLHVVAVFVPLRAFWPEEDWSITVGVAAFVGYVAVSLPLTALWLRRFRRGPLESLWAFTSGRVTRG